jgi:hypothetical protein
MAIENGGPFGNGIRHKTTNHEGKDLWVGKAHAASKDLGKRDFLSVHNSMLFSEDNLSRGLDLLESYVTREILQGEKESSVQDV